MPALPLLSLLGALLAAPVLAAPATPEPDTVRTTLVHADDVRAVYDISGDHWLAGHGRGLTYLGKTVRAYEQGFGVDADHRQLVAVVHGDAGYWLLKDDAWSRYLADGHGDPPEEVSRSHNPHAELVAELLDAGVGIEICAQTMKRNGWTAEDLVDGVQLTQGAYPRVIDLQQSGFAHVVFD